MFSLVHHLQFVFASYPYLLITFIFPMCQAFESPHTHSSCFPFLRQYAEDSFSRAACVVAPKSIISYPQVTFLQDMDLEQQKISSCDKLDNSLYVVSMQMLANKCMSQDISTLALMLTINFVKCQTVLRVII